MEISDADTWYLRSEALQPDGSWFLFMTSTYTRKK